jgi:hypothetical protein
MTYGRFYSRRQGWCGKEISNSKENCVKYYNSGIIDKLPNINLDDKDGKYISNYLKKNNLENEYKELYMNGMIYINWYFYYNDNIEIFSLESL